MKFCKKTLQLFLSVIFLLCYAKTSAQTGLIFNKRFVECEDKWVAFEKDKDGSYTFGFIYIDQMAGLTLNYESSFTIGDDDKFIRNKSVIDSSKGIYKIRLKNNDVKVAIIPDPRFDELNIKTVPDWLKFYKMDTISAARLQRWGFYYNDFGMSEKALEYLEPGYKMNPDFKGMAFELGFAYNALEKYDKAIPVLTKAIELDPKNGLLYKELSYAQIYLNKLEEAAESCRKGIKYCEENELKAEIAYNMAYQFYVRKEKENFSAWANETEKWAGKDGKIYKTIKYLEEKIKE